MNSTPIHSKYATTSYCIAAKKSSSSYTLRPVQPSDAAVLGDILYTSKIALTVNRLLFKDWPNEAVQRQSYTSTIEGLDDSMAGSVSVVDNNSGEVVGLLALTRRRPVAEKPKNGQKKPPAESAKPIFFNAEVLDAGLAAVGELFQETKGINHYGTSNRQERQYNRLVIASEPYLYNF